MNCRPTDTSRQGCNLLGARQKYIHIYNKINFSGFTQVYSTFHGRSGLIIRKQILSLVCLLRRGKKWPSASCDGAVDRKNTSKVFPSNCDEGDKFDCAHLTSAQLSRADSMA